MHGNAVGFAANLTLGSMTANILGTPTNFNGTNSYTHDAELQLIAHRTVLRNREGFRSLSFFWSMFSDN